LAALLDAEVNTLRGGEFHDAALARELAAEIDVFQPAVERQALVEAALHRPRRRQPHGHVAAVAVRDRLDFPAVRYRARRQSAACLVDLQTRSANAVGDHAAGHHGDIGLGRERPFDFREIGRPREEVVVEKLDDIEILETLDYRVALAGQAARSQDHLGCQVRGYSLDIVGRRRADDNPIGASRLSRQLLDDRAQQAWSSNGRDTDGDTQMAVPLKTFPGRQTRPDSGRSVVLCSAAIRHAGAITTHRRAFADGKGDDFMRKLLFLVALTAMLSAGESLAAAPADDTGYHLDVGDALRVKVFEWRSSVGDVHEWTALNGDYDVGADGAVSMPLLGAIKAAGLTIDQLSDTISSELQSRFGLTIRPQASIEIRQYRPFYILGDVNKPGEYPYRPGLTVLQAMSIAGGRYRVNDPALLLTTAGDLRVWRLQYNQLLARRARLQAQLSDANAITFPPELQREQNDPNVAQTIQREQAMFTAQRDALRSELDALGQLKSLLNGEVASLQDKMKNVDQELSLLKQELNSTSSLVQRGLAIMPREFELHQTELETQGRRLDLDTAALRAKEDIGKADQSMIELRNKTRNDIQTQLAEAEQKIPETAARIAAGMTIVARETNTTADPAIPAQDPVATCLILRSSGKETKTIEADETARVEPGDTIKVLRAGDRVAQPAAGPAVAEDALIPGGLMQPTSK